MRGTARSSAPTTERITEPSERSIAETSLVGALLLGEGNEPEAGAASDVEDVAVGQRDFGAGRVFGLHLVAGRDREVAPGLDLAVRRGDDE